MPTPARNTMLVLALLLPALLLIAPGGASAQEKAWDQEAVTTLATDLAAQVKDLRQSLKRGPGSSMATMQERSRYNFMDLLRLIESETGHLARRLGEGYGETAPVYRRLQRLVSNAQEEGRRLFIDEPTQERIDKAGGILDELALYYAPAEAPAESPTESLST